MITEQNTDTQVLDQIRKINERMYSLERKMDVLADLLRPKSPEIKSSPKVSPGPITPSQFIATQNNQQNHKIHNQQNNRPKERMMYTSVCADCQKECSVPFKPTGDRPIYRKECFTRRRNGQAIKPKEELKPVQAAPQAIAAAVAEETPKAHKAPKKVKAKSKVTAVKKPTAKKKTVAKKSKRK